MNATAKTAAFPVELRLQNMTLTDERKQYLRENLGALPALVAGFPTASLHADLHKHPHKGDYHVKMSLTLPNETLVTGERDTDLLVCWRHSVQQMAASVKTFKHKLARKHTYDKLGHQIDEEE